MTVTTGNGELKAHWKNEVKVKTFRKQDIQKHNTKQDLWITIHGKVYDVTEYARDHPGGLEVLLELAGADATSAFEDAGHSEDAREIMHAYLQGVVEGAAVEQSHDSGPAALPDVQITRKSASKPTSSFRENNFWYQFSVIAASTTGLAYLATHYHLLSFMSRARTQQPDGWQSSGGFVEGFLTAGTAATVAGLFGARYLSSLTSFSKSFNSYAPHIPSTSRPSATYHPAGVLIPSQYQRFRLREKIELSEGIYRFVFDLPSKYSVLGLPIGQHIAIKAMINDHSVVRSYTPVSNNRDLGRLELLIRVYPMGQIGNYLKKLAIGDFVEIRGPKGAMKYRRGMSRKLGMIGGGTGITPLFQLIRAICEDKNDDTEISLIYGNRSESDIMMRDKLDHYARTMPEKFKLFYTLDQPSASWTGARGHVTKDLLKEKMPSVSSANETKILLCGPPGMVNAMKQNLSELGFEAPSAVGKMTDQIFCF